MGNPAPLSQFRPGARVCLLAGNGDDFFWYHQVIKNDIIVTIAKGNMVTVVGPKINYWMIPNETVLVISEDGQILAIPSNTKVSLVDD